MNTSKPKGEDGRRVPLGEAPLAERWALTLEECHALGGPGLTKLRTAVKDGSLPAKQNGRCIMVLPEVYKTYLQSLPDVVPANEKGR